MISLGTEFLRGGGQLGADSRAIASEYLAIVLACALLVWRRRFPLSIAFLLILHLYVAGELVGFVVGSLPMQALYFFGLYTGLAWAQDRRRVVVLNGAVLLMLIIWFVWTFFVGADLLREQAQGEGALPVALWAPYPSMVLYSAMINLVFFVGAIVLGQFAWNAARSTATVLRQAETIGAQSEQLRDQAIIEERLRIARELHDVVAHHTAAMGVQAAAARRVLDRDPEAAKGALQAIETSSRAAVAQMRTLLGALRSGELGPGETPEAPQASTGDRRAPAPSLAAIPALVADSSVGTLTVDYQLVEAEPGAADRVPMPEQLSAYRIVQEALANVHRHSTATHASVVLRAAGYLEVEVVDNGRARRGTAGSGFGQLGIRERAQHHAGSVEIGPRHGGGYRVRVRFGERRPTEELPPIRIDEGEPR